MRWLPAVQYRGSSWLLPLSRSAADLLAARIIDACQGHGPLADREWSSIRMADLLAEDPALLIFSLLELHARHPESSGKAYDLPSHASWFNETVVDLFADGDRQLRTAQLAAVVATDCEADDQSEPIEPMEGCCDGDDNRAAPSASVWNHEALQIRQLPIDRWMERADRWLQETGPQVPEDWRRRWPLIQSAGDVSLTVASADAELTDRGGAPAAGGYAASSIDLFRLARGQRELKLLRDRFATRLQVEKMASLRQLAYGLSHEINNPLAAIRTRAEHLMADHSDAATVGRLGKIVDSAMRAHEMIADMMYFAKPPRPVNRPFDAAALTRRVVDEFAAHDLQREIPRRLHFRVEIDDPSPETLVGDPEQLGDALRALIRNAVEAVGVGGTIAIALRASGARRIWTVTDNGPGLTSESRRHAFDPYYSGREAGRGLGLGLCRVYRVARAHGGGAMIEGTEVGCRVRMWVRNQPGPRLKNS
jgi:signal transduction histidine kinase